MTIFDTHAHYDDERFDEDRHELLGEGSLGQKTFENIVNHPVLSKLPMILETPNDLPGYAREIALLRQLQK